MAPHQVSITSDFLEPMKSNDNHNKHPKKRKSSFYTVLSCRDCCVITSVDGPLCGVKPVYDSSDSRCRENSYKVGQDNNRQKRNSDSQSSPSHNSPRR